MVIAARRGTKSIARGMNIMSYRVTGKFTPCERGYIGECVELNVVVQGVTFEETLTRLKEAIAFHLEVFGDYDLKTLGERPIYQTLEIG